MRGVKRVYERSRCSIRCKEKFVNQFVGLILYQSGQRCFAKRGDNWRISFDLTWLYKMYFMLEIINGVRVISLRG